MIADPALETLLLPLASGALQWPAPGGSLFLCVLTSLALLIGGCDALPRDAAGTTDRIERAHAMRVTILPGTPDARPALALLDTYARSHDARDDIRRACRGERNDEANRASGVRWSRALRSGLRVRGPRHHHDRSKNMREQQTSFYA